MGGLGRRLLVKSALLAGFGPCRRAGPRGSGAGDQGRLSSGRRGTGGAGAGNLRNHVAARWTGAARFACVVLGPALRLFRRSGGDLAAAEDLRDRLADGVAFYACANTLARAERDAGRPAAGFPAR